MDSPSKEGEGSVAAQMFRFGAYEADVRAEELRKYGIPLKLGQQPFQILAALLERPGQLVTRGELRNRLWPADTFVEFDDGINSAVKKLRRALNDSARDPRYIETLPGRGYRLKAEVTVRAVQFASATSEVPSGELAESPPAAVPEGRLRGNWAFATIAVTLLVLAAFIVREFANTGGIYSRGEVLLDSVGLSSGRISPDGSRLAFFDVANHHLFLRDLKTQKTRLLADGFLHRRVAWAPDGKRLAFSRKAGVVFQLEVLDVESEARRIVRTGPGFDEVRLPVAWVEPSNQLLCTTQEGDWLGLVSLEDGQETTIETPGATIYWGAWVYQPSVSPDGRFIAYPYRNGRATDLMLIRADGGGDWIPITDSPQHEDMPMWSPDGRFLVFARGYGINRKEKLELWGMEIDPESGRRLGEEFQILSLPETTLSVTPTLTKEGDLFLGKAVSPQRVHLIEVDPETGEALSEPKSDFRHGSRVSEWAPDGLKLRYWDTSVSWQVASDFLTQRERDLLTGEERIRQLLWPDVEWEAWDYSGDGKQALFTIFSDGGSTRTLLHFDVETKQLRDIASHVYRIGVADFSHDFKRAAVFIKPSPGEPAVLHILNLETWEVQPLASKYRGAVPVAWTLDDRQIAYNHYPCLETVSLETGVVRNVTCTPQPGVKQSRSIMFWSVSWDTTWSANGRMLTWTVDIPDEQRVELWTINVTTGKHNVVYSSGEGYQRIPFSPKWSPDGRLIAVTILDRRPVELWMVNGLDLTHRRRGPS